MTMTDTTTILQSSKMSPTAHSAQPQSPQIFSTSFQTCRSCSRPEVPKRFFHAPFSPQSNFTVTRLSDLTDTFQMRRYAMKHHIIRD